MALSLTAILPRFPWIMKGRSLRLWFFLPQIAMVLDVAADLPHLSLVQLLAVLQQRLTMHSSAIADEISTTPSLVAYVLRVFILMPIPPSDNSPLPCTGRYRPPHLARLSFRVSASRLLDPVDALLRFPASTPASSPYPPSLATNLLIQTLRL
jgi:RNA polymerase II-associated protein 1